MPSSECLRQVLTVAQMQAAEQALVDAGTSVDELMLRAGKGAAEWVWRIGGGRPVTVLCGPGNNGGDGYVIAAEIARRGGAVRVVAPVPPKTDAARKAAEAFRGKTIAEADKADGEVLVDCLFGSGLSRPLSAEHRALLRRLRMEHTHSVAIDVPSGVGADTGAWPDGMAAWDCTLALGAWKRAHWSGEAAVKCGTLKLIDIGIGDTGTAERVSGKPKLARPAWNAHKYRRGLVGIVPGAMPGASVLAAHAAMGAGAGYVKLLADGPTAAPPPDLVLETGDLVRLLADDRLGAVLIGPGLGRDEAARLRLAAVLGSGKRLVIDADALHLLDDDLLEGADTSRIVVTPHEGELAKLCNSFGIQAGSKGDRSVALNQSTGLTVLAKGPDTLLAHAGGVHYFPQGSSWLSVAGSGDVLAGIIAARLAGGADPATAASEGVWLHHEAARAAGVAFSASALAQAVTEALEHFL
ncbi:NAD(P)H-hydrate epimerase [Erythrobacter sp. SDW2]|uniref:NAD(P)H-hydrate epimerase n=1 Tax=Erythrobacter sp. SDW2 TaxID=2907154 RepID=UPI001F47F8A9|nr:NAD(P)H-hydrate epimerase [Erythrobacter sp. SDW2]UIP05638.1 NAD(P)H-hydrate epimerase [Erythrobacter sp. SDW2]